VSAVMAAAPTMLMVTAKIAKVVDTFIPQGGIKLSDLLKNLYRPVTSG
jgi:hypothetical protein